MVAREGVCPIWLCTRHNEGVRGCVLRRSDRGRGEGLKNVLSHNLMSRHLQDALEGVGLHRLRFEDLEVDQLFGGRIVGMCLCSQAQPHLGSLSLRSVEHRMSSTLQNASQVGYLEVLEAVCWSAEGLAWQDGQGLLPPAVPATTSAVTPRCGTFELMSVSASEFLNKPCLDHDAVHQRHRCSMYVRAWLLSK